MGSTWTCRGSLQIGFVCFVTVRAPTLFILPQGASFGASRSSSRNPRNRLLGTNLFCRTKPGTTSTRGGADELPFLSTAVLLYDSYFDYTVENRGLLIITTEAHPTPQGRTRGISVRMYMLEHVVRTEFSHKKCNRGTGGAYAKRNNR